MALCAANDNATSWHWIYASFGEVGVFTFLAASPARHRVITLSGQRFVGVSQADETRGDCSKHENHAIK